MLNALSRPLLAPAPPFVSAGTPRPSHAGLVAAAAACPDGLLLTTYEQLRLRRATLLPTRWGVAVLDEGHKIRNPDAGVTLATKQARFVVVFPLTRGAVFAHRRRWPRA